MLCRICKDKGKRNKAVIFLRHHRLALCEKHFLEWFEKQVEKTIKKFRMFTRKETVLVAVSGGKDSLSLWKVLINLGYKTLGLHINLGIEKWNYSKTSEEICREFAEKNGAELVVFNLKERFGFSIEDIAKRARRKDVCSVCGTFKRYVMNLVAKERGINVIATGHNLDDEAALLLSNTMRWEIGYLGRQSPVLPEEAGFPRKVKPLAFQTEKETVSYVILSEIQFMETGCPNAKESTSKVFKQALAMVEHQMPGTKLRFYKEFLKKAKPLFEKELKKELKLKKCRECGMPTTQDVCSVCSILKKVKEDAESRNN